MFRYETHMHTRETSACGTAPGAEQAKRYKSLGYDGIIITDHFFNGNCCPEINEAADWNEKVDLFCAGYEAAKAEGDKIGLKVFFGWEYCYEGADLLTYGLDKQWLINNPDVCEINVFDYCDRVHRDGGFIVHAHPFREANYLREIRLIPQWIDAVEIYNCGNVHNRMNVRARWFAESFGFPVTGGSDNHHITANVLSGVITSQPLNSVQDYIEAVKKYRVIVIDPPLVVE